ncbi:site-specific integrase [Catellatospora coxensis]|uniref:Site-specific integrase n=1 Tax=Catellatospora coxensis TaxID=310354 RepID=A0A8J3KYU8_9ACTN|nr:site-specific integrase [Catellatospora coxensis]
MSGKSRRGHGEGSVYEFKPGLWAASVDLGWIDGKRRRKVVYAPTEAEAIVKRDALRRALTLGVNLAAPPRTIKEWLTEWLTEKERDGSTKPTTIARYRQVIDGHLIPQLGRIKLDKLSPRDVQRLVAQLRDKMAPASVIKVHGVLRVALADALRLDLVERNVAKAAKLPRLGRVERRALTPAEARKLLTEVAGDRLEAFFVLALTTGLRRGELLGLRWIDVETDEKVLFVRQTLQRVNGQLCIVSPKTHRSTRPVPMARFACEALIRHREVQDREKAATEELWRESGLVFANTLGGPMEPRNVNRRFEQARKAAGLEWLRLHDLRHAFATFLLHDGQELRTVMELLGHSTIRLTADTYGHVLPAKARDAADGIDRIMGEDGEAGKP